MEKYDEYTSMVFYETFFQHAQAIRNGFLDEDGKVDKNRGNAACLKYLFAIFNAGIYDIPIDEDDPELEIYEEEEEVPDLPFGSSPFLNK